MCIRDRRRVHGVIKKIIFCWIWELKKKNMSNFQNSIEKLDKLIFQIETNLGKAHKQGLAQRLGINPSTSQNIQSIQSKNGEIQTQKKEQGSMSQEFYSIDIRIGKIEECKIHEKADKLYCEKIKLGQEIRNIASGLRTYVTLDQMSGLVLVAVNLEPKTLCGFESSGMIICAADSKKKKLIELIRPDDKALIGERVYIDGDNETNFSQQPPVIEFKKLTSLMEQFQTDSEGFVVFQNKRLRTKSGLLKVSQIKNGYVC
eukprot:TRINITY_DN2916_c0_g1_i1.p1 TRINITY_DN2916_c0_g1~~TRINITY_DN2916_c0_g1_i1.p1  ORF type:complete len:259 (+),score=54.70 TRINITY_DN2916_c0_g1_i1:199-975(+)